MSETMNSTGLSRRSFVTGAAIGGLGIAGIAGLASCAPGNGTAADASSDLYPEFDIPGRVSMAEIRESTVIAEPITDYDSEETYDVVVVGAGVGGVPAAISAYEAGANVCLLQKEPQAVGQGTGCCRIDRDKTDELGIAHLVHSMRDYCHYRSSWKLNLLWAQNCTEAVLWYADKCVEAGMVEGTDFSSKPLGTFEYPEGNAYTVMYDFDGGMNKPTKALAEAFGENVHIHYNCPGVQLIKDGDKVVGVYAQQDDGSILRVNATKGVILATGDYQNNTAMVDKYVPDAQPFERKQSNKTGDGHLMGLMAGGCMQNAGHTKMIHAKNWGANATVLKNTPFLAVNMNGKRFVAEDITMYYRNNAVRIQPENVWITVIDSNFGEQTETMGLEKSISIEDLEAVGEEGGVYKANTLEELAEKLGIPADAFVATVQRYNELCSSGEGDMDFGKPTKYMMAIDTPPYYGLHREFAVSAITSGLEIDEHAQVLDKDRNPIEGLYAIGNCSGPFYGSIDYPAEIAGLSVSRCITFGYVTGSYVASL